MATQCINIEKELIKGIVALSRQKEFYGHVVQQLERVFVGETHTVKTAAVGRISGDRFIKMYLNLNFFEEIYKENDQTHAWTYMMGVLEHEIIHIVFGHLFLNFQDKLRGNIAKDLVVNGIIPNDTLPGNYVIPETYGLPRGKSSMWYYTQLQNNKTFQQQCASGAFGKDGVLSHIMSSHEMWEDVKEDIVAKEFAKDIIRKAKDLCNGKTYGSIPLEVIQQIEDLLKKEKAIVPWNRILRQFVASCAESVLDYTVKRISRRFNTRPGTRKGDVLRLAVAVDTSGSISDEQLKIFFNEIRWIWKNGVFVTVYEADCHIAAVYKFNGKFNGKVHGRGGTDLEPVLKDVEGKYDGLIYFTDFEAPVITRRYKIPVLWVLHSTMSPDSFPVKWGKKIRIEDGKAVAA